MLIFMILFHHPFLLEHNHILNHFPLPHISKKTKISNDRDNIEINNFKVNTKDYNSEFNVNLIIELFEGMAFK